MNLIRNNLFQLSAVLGFLGFLDSTYLTIMHYRNVLPPCTLKTGCETVLTSTYSTVGPFPLALLGSIFYLAVIFLSILCLFHYKRLYLRSLVFTVFVGFIVSLQLLLLQIFVIHAFCQYCLLSELISALLLLPAILSKDLLIDKVREK